MQRIAIIGAGCSGIAAAKAIKEEGMLPFVFEKSQRIGGVWGPESGEKSDNAAWDNMPLNNSRYTSTFSDFDWPEGSPVIPVSQDFYHYLHAYAVHFYLLPHINLGCTVLEATQQDKAWLVRWKENEDTHEQLFDAIIIASGKFTKPHIPPFKGMDKLNIRQLHSSEFRSAEEFANQDVLVVGGSFSGTAIVELLAKQRAELIAKQGSELIPKKGKVINLIKTARWATKRYRPSDNGSLLPRDLIRTYASAVKNSATTPRVPEIRECPSAMSEERYKAMMQYSDAVEQNEHEAWRMTPQSLDKLTIVEDYFTEVRAKNITPIRGEIAEFAPSGVILTNGDTLLDFDAVIFCTGFRQDLSFLSEDLRSKFNTALFYHDTFPTDIEGISAIGLYPCSRSAVLPYIEEQARYIAGVCKGNIQLPPADVMKNEIKNTPIKPDEFLFDTKIAEIIGCNPNPDEFNPGLRHMLLNEPFIPARFRLVGPHSQPEMATKMIEDAAYLRRRLVTANDKIPTLASLCLFKTQKKNKEEEVLAPTMKKTI